MRVGARLVREHSRVGGTRSSRPCRLLQRPAECEPAASAPRVAATSAPTATATPTASNEQRADCCADNVPTISRPYA